MKKQKITKEKAINIMAMYKNGVDTWSIAESNGCSQSFISVFIRAYNGNKSQYNLLAIEHRKLIDEISPNYSDKMIKYYECRLFWGLVKIKLHPIS